MKKPMMAAFMTATVTLNANDEELNVSGYERGSIGMDAAF